MKTLNKKMLLAFTFVMGAALSISGSAFAATSQSGSVGGYSTYASLSMGSSSATASTSISGTTAGLTASVTYTYGWGSITNRYTVTNNASAGSSSVSATANSNHVNPISISATGSHGVYYNSQSWTASTST